MKKAVPDYSSLPGLDYKYFTIAPGKKVGGIYLWTDREAADAFYNEAWKARIQDTYGHDAVVDFYDVTAIVTAEIRESETP